MSNSDKVKVILDVEPGALTRTTGFMTWNAAIVIKSYFEKMTAALPNMTILDISSGNGYLPLHLAKMEHGPARIIATECTGCIELLRKNVELNDLQSKIATIEYNWGDSVAATIESQTQLNVETDVDMIVFSDLLYISFRDSIEHLMTHTLLALTPLSSQTPILYVFERRVIEKEQLYVTTVIEKEYDIEYIDCGKEGLLDGCSRADNDDDDEEEEEVESSAMMFYTPPDIVFMVLRRKRDPSVAASGTLLPSSTSVYNASDNNDDKSVAKKPFPLLHDCDTHEVLLWSVYLYLAETDITKASICSRRLVAIYNDHNDRLYSFLLERDVYPTQRGYPVTLEGSKGGTSSRKEGGSMKTDGSTKSDFGSRASDYDKLSSLEYAHRLRAVLDASSIRSVYRAFTAYNQSSAAASKRSYPMRYPLLSYYLTEMDPDSPLARKTVGAGQWSRKSSYEDYTHSLFQSHLQPYTRILTNRKGHLSRIAIEYDNLLEKDILCLQYLAPDGTNLGQTMDQWCSTKHWRRIFVADRRDVQGNAVSEFVVFNYHNLQCPRHQTGSAHIDKCSDAFRASLFIQQHTDEAQRQVFQDMPGYIPLTVDKHGCLRVPLYSIQEGANGIVPYTKMHHIPYEHDRAYVNEGDDEGDSNIINKEYQEDGSLLIVREEVIGDEIVGREEIRTGRKNGKVPVPLALPLKSDRKRYSGAGWYSTDGREGTPTPTTSDTNIVYHDQVDMGHGDEGKVHRPLRDVERSRAYYYDLIYKRLETLLCSTQGSDAEDIGLTACPLPDGLMVGTYSSHGKELLHCSLVPYELQNRWTYAATDDLVPLHDAPSLWTNQEGTGTGGLWGVQLHGLKVHGDPNVWSKQLSFSVNAWHALLPALRMGVDDNDIEGFLKREENLCLHVSEDEYHRLLGIEIDRLFDPTGPHGSLDGTVEDNEPTAFETFVYTESGAMDPYTNMPQLTLTTRTYDETKRRGHITAMLRGHGQINFNPGQWDPEWSSAVLLVYDKTIVEDEGVVCSLVFTSTRDRHYIDFYRFNINAKENADSRLEWGMTEMER